MPAATSLNTFTLSIRLRECDAERVGIGCCVTAGHWWAGRSQLETEQLLLNVAVHAVPPTRLFAEMPFSSQFGLLAKPLP